MEIKQTTLQTEEQNATESEDILIFSPNDDELKDLEYNKKDHEEEIKEVNVNFKETVKNKRNRLRTHYDEDDERIKPDKMLAKEMHQGGPVARKGS